MTANELKQRQARSESLRVAQIGEDEFWVESSEGKISYKVLFNGDTISCTCADFIKGNKSNQNFRCKHVISVFNSIPTGEVKTGKLLERVKPKLDERFIISLEGHEFVRYQGLLDLAHQKGIAQIEVDTVQLPTPDNGSFAICKATVVSKNGESFTDLGDATPQNCNSKVSKHLLRLASTRAIARALRSFTNIGMTCLEELADISDVAGNGNDGKRPRTDRHPISRLRTVKKAESEDGNKTGSQGDSVKVAPVSGKTDVSDVSHMNDSPSIRQSIPGKVPDSKAPRPSDTGSEAHSAGKQTHQNGQQTQQLSMSEAQKRAIYNLSRRRGISVDELQKMAIESYGVELECLSSRDASSFIRNLQQAA